MTAPPPLVFGIVSESDLESGTLAADLAPHTCHVISRESLDDLDAWVEAEGSEVLSAMDALVVMGRHSQIAILATLAGLSRKAGTPILALDPGDSDVAAMLLLSGADSVLPREAGPDFIAANIRAYKRVRSAERRHVMAAEADLPERHQLLAGPIRADLKTFTVTVNGVPLELPPRQFDLLVYLMGQAGAVVSRCEILNNVWGIDFDPNTNIVNVYVHYLRQKLGAHGLRGVLTTVRGRGFCFRVDTSLAEPTAAHADVV